MQVPREIPNIASMIIMLSLISTMDQSMTNVYIPKSWKFITALFIKRLRSIIVIYVVLKYYIRKV